MGDDEKKPLVVRVEMVSVYEVEVPAEVYEDEEWDLADYVEDPDNWGNTSPGSAVDGYVGDILLPPESAYASWQRIDVGYRGPRDEAVHGKHGPTEFYLLGKWGAKYPTADALMRAVLLPADGEVAQ